MFLPSIAFLSRVIYHIMKNLAIFSILAIVTIAALLSWGIVNRSQPRRVVNNQQQEVTSTPTPEIGRSLRQLIDERLLGRAPTITPQPTMVIIANQPNPTGVTLSPAPTSSQPDQTKGGQPVSTPQPTRMPTPTQQQVVHGGNTIVYTDSGFSPETLSVKSGTMVAFVNTSRQQMWIKSKQGDIDMGQAIGSGGVFEYRFVSSGEWEIFNSGVSQHTMRIFVTN